jgi:GNAT superfamily N-acetyltransferase
VSERGIRILEATDEASEDVADALALIEATFERPDRQGLAELRSEVAEKRMGLLSSYDFHMFVAKDEFGRIVGTTVGAYLEGVNCGFVTYLAVDPETRGRHIGRRLRARLVEAFRANAREAGYDDLDFVLGEVRSDSPWLERLRRDGAIPFALTYYHPGMAPGTTQPAYTLYREPVAGGVAELPRDRVRRMIYSIYRRAYRVRYPLDRPGFRAMMEELGAESRV